MKMLRILAAALLGVVLFTGLAKLGTSVYEAQGITLAVVAVVGVLMAPANLVMSLKGCQSLGVATLTTAEILQDIIDAFKTMFPALNRMGTDFRPTALKYLQTYIAHVAGLPTASTYDNTTGYANGATDARGLLTDLPVVVDGWPTCPLLWKHLDSIKDKKVKYDEAIRNAAYVLAKGMIDAILAASNTRNFSKELVTTVANFDYDALTLITGAANGQKMLPEGRVLLVNTDVANVLDADSRITSKDYSGQQTGGRGLRRFLNVGGFAEIVEYPDLPSNNATALTGVTGANSGDLMTKVAHGLLTGDPVTFVSGTSFTGLTADTKYWAIKASADTFQVATTYANAIAGIAVALSADGTDGVFQRTENLIGIAFDSRAYALLAGIPEGFNSEMMAQLNIPQLMGFEALTDVDTGLTMAAVSWQQVGTGNLYWCPTFVWGKSVGKQGGVAGTLTDYAALRIVSK